MSIKTLCAFETMVERLWATSYLDEEDVMCSVAQMHRRHRCRAIGHLQTFDTYAPTIVIAPAAFFPSRPR